MAEPVQIGSEMAGGTVFAGHRIEAVAGRGGMGVVYRATQLALDRIVALKVIAPGLMDDATMRARFVRESKIAASIDHPNVIPIYYAGEEAGIAYIAMRYVPGDDLRSLVRREGPLGTRRAARLVAQIGAALDAAHAAGLVHRDVKPANVLLGPDEHVYLTDFGLTKHALSAAGSTRPGHWVGTLDYVAPEQIRGERVDARADIYALGCVLYFVLTGRVPFPRQGDEAKLWAHLSEPPPHPSERRPELPPGFDEVAERALAKQPDDRYPSAGDLGRAALAAVEDESVREPERLVAVGAAAPTDAPTITSGKPVTTQVKPEGATARLPSERERPGRRRALAGLALAVLVAAAVAAIVLVDGGDRTGAESTPTATPTATAAAEPQVTATVRVAGYRPNGLVVAGGNVWLSSFKRQRLGRVDPDASQPRLAGRGPSVGVGASSVASGFGTVWVPVSRQRRVVRLDPETGARRGAAFETESQPTSVETGRGSLWVAELTPTPGGQDVLRRLDPRSGAAIGGGIAVPEGIRRFVVTERAIWIVARRNDLVLRIDPGTGATVRRIRVGTNPQDIVAGGDSLWVTNRGDDTVSRIDATSNDVQPIRVGALPTNIAVRGRWAWVTNAGDNTVTRIDVRASRASADPIPVGLNPGAITAAAGEVWVANVSENTLSRIEY